MYIIPGENVDLISPFPPAEVGRIFGWKHCYRTLPEDDDTPSVKEEFTLEMEHILPYAISCGIIDKGQVTSARHEAPLVGIIFVTPQGRDATLHLAIGRKAFKMGLADEALALALPRIFATDTRILRVSCLVDEANVAVKQLLKRHGFQFEGVMRNATLVGNIPRARVIFGLTREQVEQTQQEGGIEDGNASNGE
jgi:RimJ/RimL family protein N-acetyltransferase